MTSSHGDPDLEIARLALGHLREDVQKRVCVTWVGGRLSIEGAREGVLEAVL